MPDPEDHAILLSLSVPDAGSLRMSLYYLRHGPDHRLRAFSLAPFSGFDVLSWFGTRSFRWAGPRDYSSSVSNCSSPTFQLDSVCKRSRLPVATSYNAIFQVQTAFCMGGCSSSVRWCYPTRRRHCTHRWTAIFGESRCALYIPVPATPRHLLKDFD